MLEQLALLLVVALPTSTSQEYLLLEDFILDDGITLNTTQIDLDLFPDLANYCQEIYAQYIEQATVQESLATTEQINEVFKVVSRLIAKLKRDDDHTSQCLEEVKQEMLKEWMESLEESSACHDIVVAEEEEETQTKTDDGEERDVKDVMAMVMAIMTVADQMASAVLAVNRHLYGAAESHVRLLHTRSRRLLDTRSRCFADVSTAAVNTATDLELRTYSCLSLKSLRGMLKDLMVW